MRKTGSAFVRPALRHRTKYCIQSDAVALCFYIAFSRKPRATFRADALAAGPAGDRPCQCERQCSDGNHDERAENAVVLPRHDVVEHCAADKDSSKGCDTDPALPMDRAQLAQPQLLEPRAVRVVRQGCTPKLPGEAWASLARASAAAIRSRMRWCRFPAIAPRYDNRCASPRSPLFCPRGPNQCTVKWCFRLEADIRLKL